VVERRGEDGGWEEQQPVAKNPSMFIPDPVVMGLVDYEKDGQAGGVGGG
jgi:hypothetical protein